MSKSNQAKIDNSIENWESRKLGASDEFARAAGPEADAALDAALSMKPISIRMPKSLIEQLKLIASFHNVGYQPLMRDVLVRFCKAELKDIVRQLEAESDSSFHESPAEGYFDEDKNESKVA